MGFRYKNLGPGAVEAPSVRSQVGKIPYISLQGLSCDAFPCFRGPAVIPRQAEEVRNGKESWDLYKSLALNFCLWDSFPEPLGLPRSRDCWGQALLVQAREQRKGKFGMC